MPMNESDAIASSAERGEVVRVRHVDADERRDDEEQDRRADQPVEHRERALAEQVRRPRQRRHERVLDRPLPALPGDRLRHELEDDPEERPDDGADEQPRRELVLLRAATGRTRARDEHDRERVRDRPDHEREVPEEVALREIDVPLDDAAEADELLASHARWRSTRVIRTPPCTRRLRRRAASFSNSRPVAAKNASSSVSTPKRRFTSSTGSRKSSSPRSSRPMRSASASASAMSCVQRRIVASCSTRTSRMNSCTSSFERGSRPVVGSSSSSSTGEVRSARASATFCCMPRDRFSIDSLRRSAGKPTFSRISGILCRVCAGVIP